MLIWKKDNSRLNFLKFLFKNKVFDDSNQNSVFLFRNLELFRKGKNSQLEFSINHIFLKK